MDALNVKIAKQLMNNPDISSVEIATICKSPLSTVQRRRAKLEESLLKKNYSLDVRQFGWRVADLLIAVDKGKGEEVAKRLLHERRDNVLSVSLRIGHPQVNIIAEVFYRNSEELHNLIESIKAYPEVSMLEWSETVKVVGRNNYSAMLDAIFLNIASSIAE
jgi:DNA-binding Lrp family transcriptional regulator